MPTFPSPEWLQAYADEIARSESVRAAAKDWDGDITLVVEAEPSKGVPQDLWTWYDLSHGEFRGAKVVTPEEGERAKFVIRAPYSTWRDVIRGRVDPLKGMTQGKLKLSGDLPKLKENVRAVAELVSIAAKISTDFVDE